MKWPFWKKKSNSNGTFRRLPWYSDGLKFTCTRCGQCCTGGPGNVWVNENDIAVLAEKFQSSLDAFKGKYVRTVGDRLSFHERENGDCIFFDRTQGCSVYELRPLQCKTWPFWEQNVACWSDWKDVCRVCPGAGVGELHGLTEIEKQKTKV